MNQQPSTSDSIDEQIANVIRMLEEKVVKQMLLINALCAATNQPLRYPDVEAATSSPERAAEPATVKRRSARAASCAPPDKFKPAKPGKGFINRPYKKTDAITNAIRELAPKLTQPFRCGDIKELIQQKHPNIKQVDNVGYYLILLAERGELIREGSRAGTTYRVGKLQEANVSAGADAPLTDKEKRYREFSATVPRPQTDDDDDEEPYKP